MPPQSGGMEIIMTNYVTEMRRELHMYPEIGFDLTRTLALVRRELEKMDIPYTEKYGQSSIVATLNDEKSQFTIGIRADMDALPVLEKNNVPYKSKIKGQMHACGHDGHTAILLDTARQLSEMKDKINCRVKFIFQAAEEYPPSGAKLMAEDGVMDDIDCVIALHIDPSSAPTGKIALTSGPVNATSNGFMLDFFGKSAHAALQHDGVDAIMMAVKAYTAIEMMVAKEFPATAARIFNCGAIHGGETNNVICPHASMFCTVRSWEEEVDAKIIRRIKEICSAIARESGGKFKFTQKKYYPIVNNDDEITELIRRSAAAVIGEENILPHRRTMGGEDFAYFARLKPGCMFRLGTRNEEKDCIYSLHQDKFNIDEDSLSIGSAIFVRFVLDNMNGLKKR